MLIIKKRLKKKKKINTGISKDVFTAVLDPHMAKTKGRPKDTKREAWQPPQSGKKRAKVSTAATDPDEQSPKKKVKEMPSTVYRIN